MLLLGGEAVPVPAAGLEIWAEADINLVLNGAKVIQWGSSSGGRSPLEQASDAKRPLLVADRGDGKETIRADAVDDVLVTAGSISINPFTLFFVAQDVGDANTRSLVTHRDAVNTDSVEILNTATVEAQTEVRNVANETKKTWPAIGAVSWPVYRLECNASNASHLFYKDGVLLGEITNGSTADPSAGILEPFALFARDFNSTLFWDGDCSAVLLYSRLTSAPENTLIEAYLSRWS